MNQHDLDVLDEIQQRVLWLATRIVDAANHDRGTGDGVKVGGHQASSASLVTAMTALWFAHLTAEDRVAVKPHASPVFHAITYLLGNLDRSYLTRLRARGGLQSYPSRTKDPDEVDFSTGSVGLGAAAPLFAAVTRRYVDAHFGERPHSRFVALIGDAELDEGNIWEAVADPATTGLGNVMWVVDFNRQSLDRVVPGVRIDQWRGQFEAAGWHVVEVKYGRRLAQAYARPGGEALRDWIDAMPNEQYQSLFGLTGPALRKQFLDGAPDGIAALIADVADEELGPLVTDLGGHDLASLLDAYAQCDAVTDRPSVVFAYTVKGWGLPIAGNPRNHSALLSGEQVDALRAAHGLTRDTEWDRLDPASPAGIRAGQRREALSRAPRERALRVTVPQTTKVRANKPISSQEVFGRVLVDLARDPQVGRYLVTTAPDVATSTNLAGFINKTGVFAPTAQRSWSEDRMLRWTESPDGQHIELGISEMNLFLLLGQLGLAWDLSGQPLLPVGTVYDPFVLRGLDAFLYGTYSGSRFVVAGTPSGITLAPEGGAHQSTITASVGLELPGVTFVEPAYAGSLDWLLCDALGHIAGAPQPTPTAAPAEDGAYYFRLSTRPLDQTPFEAARARLGDAVLRRQVLAGAYRLVDAHQAHPHLADAPTVQLAASGAVLPEVLAAAAELADEGVAAHVVDVTSLDRLYRAWQRTLRQGVRTATVPSVPGALRAAFADRVPVVTVHDAASHAMAWLGSAVGAPAVPLGVDEFGQSGTVHDLYELHDLLPGSIVNAALAAISLR
ncbi:pyruvate dehydrogenase E1 component [Micromonospora phaseoli]|uniref:Pyruvate dehydrogenase E1 component n=1 Tax=Micromonospora phaseoli TaxID=1144548 RepID=A0A1H6RGC0_9ACTN|nr:1-deoxy-D-xylulose-5-phosphate synthase N-terminal domain-containing protein [Micromonospora phaseoli]PZW03336.1 pyruvate dehydrogenase E1 component [Micromonospora phaseoli]GIJ78329.1 1-deoxy-D-xylulose-5-phosphate synthase [Micromonospora phaseoli]SEI51577.1 pyruvate dehydrogenase E1 component [Micromonospora phaseoli]